MIDDDDLGGVDLIQHASEYLVEVVPVGPITDDEKIPVQKALGQPLCARCNSIGDRRRSDLPWRPAHVLMVFRAASVHFHDWTSGVSGQRGAVSVGHGGRRRTE